MGLYFIRFLLFIKARIKSPLTYIWIFFIASSLYLVNRSVIPLENPSDVYILNRAGEYGDRVISLLQEDGNISAFRYIETDDEEYLRNEVKKGSAHVGFIFPEDMEERILNGDTKKMITMVTSVFSVKGAAVRERVFAALFRVMNIDIVKNAEKDIFEDPEAVHDYVRERYDHYSTGKDVFGIEYEYVDAPSGEEIPFIKDSSDPLRGCASVLIFILCLYSGGTLLGTKGRFYNSLGRYERFTCRVLYELASVLIPATGAFIAISILDGYKNGLMRDMICYIVFIVISCIWSAVFVSFFRKSEIYFPVVSVLLFVCFVICPVFADLGKYIKVLSYVSRVLPPAFYLYML